MKKDFNKDWGQVRARTENNAFSMGSPFKNFRAAAAHASSFLLTGDVDPLPFNGFREDFGEGY